MRAGGRTVVDGFYAADGDAAESGATGGNVWQVRFTPVRAATGSGARSSARVRRSR
jgi:hypothetical protein